MEEEKLPRLRLWLMTAALWFAARVAPPVMLPSIRLALSTYERIPDEILSGRTWGVVTTGWYAGLEEGVEDAAAQEFQRRLSEVTPGIRSDIEAAIAEGRLVPRTSEVAPHG